MKTVAFVPIKLNSERLPRKNLLPVNGKPMCYHIVNTLLQVSAIDEVYVYCSSPEVVAHIPAGAQFLQRCESLDGNLVKGNEIYSSFIAAVKADTYVLAHTTSPFIRGETIDHALKQMRACGHDSAFSAKEVRTFVWYEGQPVNFNPADVPRTQDLEPVYAETSGFYAFNREVFIESGRRTGTNPFIAAVDEFEGIDIDTKDDYDMALALAALRTR